jgi:hypothetical protein
VRPLVFFSPFLYLSLVLFLSEPAFLACSFATLGSYDGDYRGVGFVPHVSDGETRHYAYLPLDLF